MIDYKKLELAHELAKHITIDSGKRADVYVSLYDGDYPMYGFRHYATSNDLFETMDIDDLITKLQELTQPKPKYEINMPVWHMHQGNLSQGAIKDYYKDKYGYDYFLYAFNEPIPEIALYPSREALVEAQIQHWTCLKYEEKSTGSEDMSKECACDGYSRCRHCGKDFRELGAEEPFENKECEHEPTHESYLSCPPKQRCIKCGEFY